MKKILLGLAAGIVVTGCGASLAGNGKDYSKSAAVNLSALVSVTGTGVDTPTDEANANVAKINSAVVNVFNSDDKLLNTIKLNKVSANTKGEILEFSSGFVGIPAGSVRVKFDFNDASNKSLFSTEGKADLKAKTVFIINGNLEQVSIKKDPGAKESLNTDIKEIPESSYVAGEIIIGLKDDTKEDTLKSLLSDNGIKVTSLNNGSLKSYTVKFSSPSVAEALILANQTGKFEYVEQDGFVNQI